MKSFLRLLKADFQKLRHSPMFWIHILIPTIGVILFLSYYSFSGWSSTGKVKAYLEALSITFPFLIGVICAMMVEQEALAGHFQQLLMARGKITCFFSKVVMLLLLELTSIIIAVVGFAIGFQYLLHQNHFPFQFYGVVVCILFFSQIFLYLLHLICSFQFGIGASIGIGILESLIAALMLTGLGEKIWKWIPCSWGGRLCGNYLGWKYGIDYPSLYFNEFKIGAMICLVLSIMLLLVCVLWFHYYEGRNEN